MELPLYRCHKEVRALKIAGIDHSTEGDRVTLIPADEKFAPFDLSPEYVLKHKPQIGGYYVVYKDGYESYSPAKAFEEGYVLADEVCEEISLDGHGKCSLRAGHRSPHAYKYPFEADY